MPALHFRIWQNPIVNDNLMLDLRPGVFDIQAANFQTLATSGFGPGMLTLRGVDKADIYKFLNNYMMKRVTATDGAGFTAYEGYIAEIRATVDSESYEVVVDNFADATRVQWTEADPLHPGSVRTVSAFVPNSVNLNANATAAQNKYGIKEKWLDLSGDNVITRAQAIAAANTYLNQMLKPQLIHHRARGGLDAGERSVEFALWGYSTTLAFRQINTRYGPSTEIKTIIQNALTANLQSSGAPQQFIATTDVTGLSTTSTVVPYNAGGRWSSIDEYINGLMKYGDPNNRRILFQVWEDRKPWLKLRPTSVGYYTRSDAEMVWTGARAATMPWRVRAGQYMIAEDFPVGLEAFADVDGDPRAYLIEQTSFDAISGNWEAIPAGKENTDILLGRMRRKFRQVKT